MSMKAKFLRDSIGNILVQMEGDFDYATSRPLRSQLSEVVKKYPETKIQIDLSGMNFVGSSGISHFVETLKILKDNKSEKIRLSNVSNDFHKVFELYGLTRETVDFIDETMNETASGNLSQRFAGRKRTFEN